MGSRPRPPPLAIFDYLFLRRWHPVATDSIANNEGGSLPTRYFARRKKTVCACFFRDSGQKRNAPPKTKETSMAKPPFSAPCEALRNQSGAKEQLRKAFPNFFKGTTTRVPKLKPTVVATPTLRHDPQIYPYLLDSLFFLLRATGKYDPSASTSGLDIKEWGWYDRESQSGSQTSP